MQCLIKKEIENLLICPKKFLKVPKITKSICVKKKSHSAPEINQIRHAKVPQHIRWELLALLQSHTSLCVDVFVLKCSIVLWMSWLSFKCLLLWCEHSFLLYARYAVTCYTRTRQIFTFLYWKLHWGDFSWKLMDWCWNGMDEFA